MEKKYHSESYNPSACCGVDCRYYRDNEDEPCWGDVSVVAEETSEDDCWWVHECEGHEGSYEAAFYGGEVKYKIEPKTDSNLNADN